MTKTNATLNAIRAIPPEKLGTKLKKTAVGVIVAGGSVAATKWLGAPWYIAVGGGLLGATIWSGEIVTAPLKLLGSVLADLYQKVKASNG